DGGQHSCICRRAGAMLRGQIFTSGCHSSILLTSSRDILTLDDYALKDIAMQPEGSLLLRTKLDVPPPRPHTLPRERLLTLLPSAPGTRLVLLCAPAGVGKTTLLATWCHALIEQGRAAVSWLALDEGDND